MNILKIMDDLDRIAENEPNEDKAKTLIFAYLKESKRKYLADGGEVKY